MSKEGRSAQIFYIIIIPIVLIVVLLNSGLLQTWLPAASCGGTSFSAVRYDYYYYSCYNEFVEQNADQLSTLGYSQKAEPKDQQYDAGTTWEEHFRQLAEARLSYAVYYNTLADQAGYVCTEEDLAPVQEKLDTNKADYTKNGIFEKNYYKSYYGPGMTKARYQKELNYEVRAKAYAAYLQSHTQVTKDEISQYMTQKQMADYPTVKLRLIAMNAITDRFSGKVGDDQLNALTERLSRLSAKLEADPSQAESLARTYSKHASASNGGILDNQTKSSVPACLSAWCFDASRKIGDSDTVVDKDNGVAYWVSIEGFGDSGASIEATTAIQAEKAAAREKTDLSSYPVAHNSIGMTIVG
jgi:hypothetical protein